jgi:hypothetical protein
MISTSLGYGEVISRVNGDGEVLVILRKRDNPEWKYNGAYIFKMISIEDCKEVEE